MRYGTVIAAAMIAAASAAAHDLGVDCSPDGDLIKVEVYFDDNTDAASAKIRVLAAGVLIAEGTADERGHWTFPKPAGPFVVEVDAGAGHRTRKRFDFSREQPSVDKKAGIREEFTRFRWQGLVIGLAIIAVVGFIAWIGLKRRGVDKPHP
jgi:hypothetical protein